VGLDWVVKLREVVLLDYTVELLQVGKVLEVLVDVVVLVVLS
jgi:hypothetical protein